MKRSILAIAVVAMISCNNTNNNEKAGTSKTDSASAVAAKPAETPPPPPPMDSATKMKKMMEYSTPGDMHKMMASWSGKWTTEGTMWDEENKPPMKSTGSCENKMLLGGRFMQSIHKGNMMGMPFEGIGMTGYDNTRKVFVNSWQDNMGTSIMYLEGPYDAATKTMTLKGSWDDPIKGPMEIRQVITVTDDKHQSMEMYGTPKGGKEIKWLEMKLAKK